jgi:hypothetical protein
MGLPLLLIKPVFLCNGNVCSEDDACAHPPLVIDEDNSQNTISKEFEFYCEQSGTVSWVSSLYFAGNY